MPCRECIHNDVCYLHEDNFMDSAKKNGFCGKFKNKIDFVKVIRCKDCRFYFPPFCYRPKNRPHQTHGILPEYFCSYGERQFKKE